MLPLNWVFLRKRNAHRHSWISSKRWCWNMLTRISMHNSLCKNVHKLTQKPLCWLPCRTFFHVGSSDLLYMSLRTQSAEGWVVSWTQCNIIWCRHWAAKRLKVRRCIYTQWVMNDKVNNHFTQYKRNFAEWRETDKMWHGLQLLQCPLSQEDWQGTRGINAPLCDLPCSPLLIIQLSLTPAPSF